jgi:ABC-type sugar transport system substrate-binding protein
VIGVSTDSGRASFRKIELDGLYKAAKAAGNVKILEMNADENTSTQNAQIKAMVDQKVDAIIVCAIDKDAIQSAFDYVQDNKIPLILYDRAVQHPWVSYTVAYDSWSDAQQLAKFIESKNDGKPHKIFLTVGSLADPNGIARRDGFYSIISKSKYPNLQVIEIMTDWDVNKCLTNMENALQVNPDVWAVINVSAHMDGSCYRALQEKGLMIKRGEKGHVFYASLSGDPPSLDFLQKGYTDAVYIIPAEMCGGKLFEAAMKLIKGEPLESKSYMLPTWPLLPNEFAAKKDKVWSVIYADLIK